MRTLVFTSASVGYFFYMDSTGFVYSKTTDGGASWGAPVSIRAVTTIIAFDVWYDKWTPGDTGDLIHIAYFDSTLDDIFYRNLDTTSDTLGTQTVADAQSTAVAGLGSHCSITKSRSGNLYISSNCDNGTEISLVRSINGGANWAARTSILEAASSDWAQLFPATGTGDDADIWAVYLDHSDGGFTIKQYDDSANTVSESASMATVTENTTDTTGQYPFSASVRHSDGHLIVAVVTERDPAGASADHRLFDVASTASITELTAIATNTDDHYYPSVYIDQNTDDIYVGYVGHTNGVHTLGTSAGVYTAVSTDGGSSWSLDNLYSATGGLAALQTWMPLSGDRMMIVWKLSTSLATNFDNSLDLAASGITMAADAGSFAISGTAASLEQGYAVDAEPGSVVITGTAASLEQGYEVSAEAGAFTITGTDASLELSEVIEAESGSFVITGTAASLEQGYVLEADAGAVTITGQDAGMNIGLSMPADAGAFTITGTAATLIEDSEIEAESGSFTITGTDADLSVAGNTIMPADAGEFAITGTAASLEQGYAVDAEAGAFAITGTAATLSVSIRLSAEAGVFSITGTAANLLLDQVVEAESGSFAISGTAADLTDSGAEADAVGGGGGARWLPFNIQDLWRKKKRKRGEPKDIIARAIIEGPAILLGEIMVAAQITPPRGSLVNVYTSFSLPGFVCQLAYIQPQGIGLKVFAEPPLPKECEASAVAVYYEPTEAERMDEVDFLIGVIEGLDAVER
jgi:hypothetical protein